jgi:hypothetical protein
MPGERAVAIQYHSGVVIEPRRAALEQRADDDQFQFARQPAQMLGGGTGDRLGQIEERGVFGLAK